MAPPEQPPAPPPPAPPSAASESWQLASFLTSAGVATPIASVLRDSSAAAGAADDLAAARQLAAAGKAALCSAMRSRAPTLIEDIAEAIWPAFALLADPRQAATAEELHDKFLANQKGVEMEFAGLEVVHCGLEAIIGVADPRVGMAMKREHTLAPDAQQPFLMPNGKSETTSAVEYNFVADPERGADGQYKPFEPYPPPPVAPPPGADAEALAAYEKKREAYKPRQPRPIGDYEPERRACNEQLAQQGEQPVSEQEVIGARMYTGPMCAPPPPPAALPPPSPPSPPCPSALVPSRAPGGAGTSSTTR